MRNSAFALVVALVVGLAAHGQTLKLPAEVKGSPGAFIVIRAETDGTMVKWHPLTNGLNVFPGDLLAAKTVTVVTANAPGRYKLLAYTAKGDVPSDPAIVEVVVGEDPGPGPVPPDPKPPIPPGPVDPLTKRIWDALLADTDVAEDKRKHVAALAGFYSAMASHVADKSVATVGDLVSDYRNAIPAVLPEDAIKGTRKVCGEAVFALSGEDPERAIDASLRKAFVDLFTKIAASLETYKTMRK